jgi:hypothetical protein
VGESNHVGVHRALILWIKVGLHANLAENRWNFGRNTHTNSLDPMDQASISPDFDQKSRDFCSM